MNLSCFTDDWSCGWPALFEEFRERPAPPIPGDDESWEFLPAEALAAL